MKYKKQCLSKQYLREVASNREFAESVPSEIVVVMARQLLASMEQEPVVTFYKSDHGNLFNTLDGWRPVEGVNNLYAAPRLPQPAPVVPALLWKMDSWRGAPCNGVEWAKGYQAGWNKYHQWLGERRAAMLQGESVNTPSIPNGWKLVPIDPTKDMLRAGQSVVGFWLNTVHCYSKMLAAAPAAPQQETRTKC